PPTHPALLALAGRLDQLLREDERYLLLWTSHGVPMRMAAEWLGLSQSVAAKRLSRLRTRLGGGVYGGRALDQPAHGVAGAAAQPRVLRQQATEEGGEGG